MPYLHKQSRLILSWEKIHFAFIPKKWSFCSHQKLIIGKWKQCTSPVHNGFPWQKWMCLLISPSIEVQYFVSKMDVAFTIVKCPQACRMGRFYLFICLFVHQDQRYLKTYKLRINQHTRRLHPALSELLKSWRQRWGQSLFSQYLCFEDIQVSNITMHSAGGDPLSLNSESFSIDIFW